MKHLRNKILNMPVQAKAAFIYTIASFATKGFHLITTPLFTRIMTVSQIGVVANYSTWSAYISTVAALGITSGSLNVMLKKYKDDRDGYLKTAQTLTTISSLLVGGLLLLLYPLIKSIIGMPVSYIVLMFICMIFSFSQTFWMTKQKYEYKYRSVAVVVIGTSVLSALFSLSAVIIAKNNGQENLSTVRVFVSNLSILIFNVPIFLSILIKKKPIFNKEYAKESLIIGLPMIFHTLAKSLLVTSDRVMIKNMCGDEALGYYSVIYMLGSLTLIVWDAINASLVPFIYEHLETEKSSEQRINKIVTSLVLAFGICSVVLAFLAPEVVLVIASKKYSSAVYVMPPIVAGIFFIALYTLYANLIIYKGRTKTIMVSTVVAAVFNLVLNYVFISAFGYIAASYTTLASYILLAIIYKVVSKRIFGRKVYNDRILWIISLIVTIICLLCPALYSTSVIRYIIILVIIVVVVLMRKKIIFLLNEIRNNPSNYSEREYE